MEICNFRLVDATGEEIPLSSATFTPDPNTNTVTIANLPVTLAPGDYKLTVENVQDEEGNPIPADGVTNIANVRVELRRVNINTATEEELTTVPRIGSARIRTILERRATAPIKNLDELREALRLKDVEVEALRNSITFE